MAWNKRKRHVDKLSFNTSVPAIPIGRPIYGANPLKKFKNNEKDTW